MSQAVLTPGAPEFGLVELPIRTSEAPTRTYFHTLAAMRGIAALFVVTYHVGPYFRPFNDPVGYFAVDLFFLLSGCVIEASYGDKLRGGLSLLSFIRIRLVRLYPLYMLGTIITLVAVTTARGGIQFAPGIVWTNILHPWLMFVLGAFFIPVCAKGNFIYPLNPPAWSLFWEVMVNLVYAAALPVLNRKTLAVVIAIAGAVLIGIHADAIRDPARAFFSFFLGVLMYRERGTWKSAWAGRAALAIVCVTLAWQRDIYVVAVFLAFPAAVWLALHAEAGIPISRLFDRLGDVSYPIYALHMPLAILLLAVAGPLAPSLWMGLAFIITLIVLAVILNRYYDAPLRRLFAPRPETQKNRDHIPGVGRMVAGKPVQYRG